MTWRWLTGLARKRPIRLLATAAGVAIAVSLLAGLGGFVVSSEQTMTDRVAAGVAVDWQVAVTPRHHLAQVIDALRADPHTTAALSVGFADAPGLHARAGGTVQDTGAARVLGLPPDYQATFPHEGGRRGGAAAHNCSRGRCLTNRASGILLRDGEQMTEPQSLRPAALRRASLMRSCQPGPSSWKCASTSRSRRSETSSRPAGGFAVRLILAHAK